MSNYCPSIAMPKPRKDVEMKRPYDVPVRPESIVNLDFKRTRAQKITGLVALAQMTNTLGKAFIVKREYEYAMDALMAAKVRFFHEDDQTLLIKQIAH